MNNGEEFVNTYKSQFWVYNAFSEKLRDLLHSLLVSRKINYTNIEHRAKDVEHFREKINRPGKSYQDPLNEITDLCGLRIIVRQVSDIDKVIEMVDEEFTVDKDNSGDKAEELKVNEFGYLSVHLVVTLGPNHRGLPGYQGFDSLKAEIQVRTMLQHIWADISHNLDYKAETEIPQKLRRQLFRLSAFLELADQEFDRLVEYSQEKVKYYKTRLAQGDKKIEVNADSLQAYIETAEEARYWIQYGRSISEQPIDSWRNLSTMVGLIQFCDLKHLQDIKDILNSARSWGKKFLPEVFADLAQHYNYQVEEIDTTQNGLILALIIAAKEARLTNDILQKDFKYPPTNILDIARRVRGSNISKRKTGKALQHRQ